MSSKTWRIAGLCFDHPHQEDQLAAALKHPRAEVVGVFDTDVSRMREACERLSIGLDLQYSDYEQCLEATQPDIVILCPTTAAHADWTERVAPYGVHVLMEKPFASSLEDADRMVRAVEAQGMRLAVNWPMEWYRTNQTTKRLLSEGVIGDIRELHFYDGGRDVELDESRRQGVPTTSWWYRSAHGGGALQDYLGYGTTLGTWFLDGGLPAEVTALSYTPGDLEVDTHAVAVARYGWGLATFQPRWDMFANAWDHPTQPPCGFVIGGTRGTITAPDHNDHIVLQTVDSPNPTRVAVDRQDPSNTDSVAHFIHCLEEDRELEGPASPSLSRLGQAIVDAAVVSIAEGRSVSPTLEPTQLR